MNDGDRLYRAILEDPFDDAPRLIYADWLDDRGEAERANFIRDQIEAHNLYKAGTISYCDYLGTKRYDWLYVGERQAIFNTVFVRGFPSVLEVRTLHIQDYGNHAKEIFSQWPITKVFLEGIDYDTATVNFGRELAGFPPLKWPE